MKLPLNDNWHFTSDKGHDEIVRLPHSFIETPFNNFDESIYQMIGTYQRTLTIPNEWNGKSIVLCVEGAAHYSEIKVNGTVIDSHTCGYSANYVELKDVVLYGEDNLLEIMVDSHETLNQPPFGFVIDYMTYGGLYREVTLNVRDQNYIKDVFAYKQGNTLQVDVTMNESNVPTKRSLWLEDTLIAESDGNFDTSNLEVWELDHPVLYTLRVESETDTYTTTIGIRDIEFKSDGFYLNGKKTKIRGLNRHQSYPYVGYAMPESMQREDARILKNELHCNTVRTSHYPMSQYFLDECDRQGLLVFTEIPGWQHIGNEEWQDKAVQNVEDMVLQYRNHPSIILWGVRINESIDNDQFYTRTNQKAHELDVSRPTSGVRYLQKSSLLEDVYAYNDFLHDGTNAGCTKKKAVSSDMNKGYLISEYNGHMFPTKSYDNEDHRTEHMLRHARVMNAYYGEDDIAGGIGWCMNDYNTHKDFGSGDRICYHGVQDMWRNKKMAAYVYSIQDSEEPILELSSQMDIGEHPACFLSTIYAMTNLDRIKLYKNDIYIRDYTKEDTDFKDLPYPVIKIDDFIGNRILEEEGYAPGKAKAVKYVLLGAARYGMSKLPLSVKLAALKCIVVYHLSMKDAYRLYNKYLGNWGSSVTTYRFEGYKDDKLMKSVFVSPAKTNHLVYTVSHTDLKENSTYDVASVRLECHSDTDALLHYASDPITFETEGDIALIGPNIVSMQGGMCGTYVKSIGTTGTGTLIIRRGNEVHKIEFTTEIGGK